MKTIALLTALTTALLVSAASQARDTTHFLPIEKALSAAQASGKIDGGVKFFFADQPHPGIAKDYGTYTSNKKTNAFAKSDETACDWAMQSALISLFNRAIKEGADAVVGVESFYNKQVYRDSEKYECHAGAMVAGVVLRGQVVKLK